MNIGEKIRQLRTDRGITQSELAQMLFVSAQAVSKWETGKSVPNIQMLPVISKVFEVPISELFE